MTTDELIEYIKSDKIKQIIVDCDAGADGDDQFALAYALRAKDKVKVIAVNSAPFNDNSDETSAAGKVECEEIIKAAGERVPVYCGSADYITRAKKPIESEAARNIRDAVISSDEPVTAVISGCCTNVASALALYPEIRSNLIVVWLALDDLDGDHNTGEYNYHNDIEAGKLLFSLAENTVLVCAGKVVAPYRRTDDEIDEMFPSDDPLAAWLRRRFREVTWAQGLWDLCAEGLLIKPEACKIEKAYSPVFGDDGEIISFDHKRPIAVVNYNDSEEIISDCVKRING